MGEDEVAVSDRWVLLSELDDDERRALLARARRRAFGRREVIFHAGDAGDSVHLLAKGHVAITITTPLGDTALVRVLRPGDWFGELVLIDAGPRSATATAVEGAETMMIHRDEFDELRRRSPRVQEVLVRALAGEVRRLTGALADAQYLSAEARLWRRLLELTAAFGDAPPVELPLTQDELAQLAGATRQTVNRLLREAEGAGALKLSRGRCVVLDVPWMRRAAGIRG